MLCGIWFVAVKRRQIERPQTRALVRYLGAAPEQASRISFSLHVAHTHWHARLPQIPLSGQNYSMIKSQSLVI